MRKAIMSWLCVMLCIVGAGSAYANGVYLEKDGLVIMEMENTASDLGLWVEKTDISGYTGDGYLEFTGNTPLAGNPNSPLEFEFKIDQGGLYYLHLHCARETLVINDETRQDVANDAFVRVEGDYGAGPNAGDSHGDDATLSLLKSDTKFFGGLHNRFSWASGLRLDPGGHDNKRVAIYDFKAGETYKLVVSGRSKFFKVNRIIFRHETVADSTAQNLNNPESEIEGASITGELRQWHKVTLTFDGPTASETGTPNPFLDYRMDVTFTHPASGLTYMVPGYFAADGNAGETGATSGNKWRAHLSPDHIGDWNYVISFHSGSNVSVGDAGGGTALAPYDGMTGSFTIMESDKTATDFRTKGRLVYDGTRYLKHASNGTPFIKTGADAPESFLSYEDFDNTYRHGGTIPIKSWGPHVIDWKIGDPTWKNGMGKGIIGAINYLASEGQNVFSFLTYSAGGDTKSIWPYLRHDNPLNFDCSKLDQWEIVFQHGQNMGMYLHFKTQEQENDNHPTWGLDGGNVGTERKLYYRELIARFGHHLALNWNLGEENSQTAAQEKAMAQYFYDTDPYHHNIVLHTFPDEHDRYDALHGDQSKLTGASIQADWTDVHANTLEQITKSTAAGKPWVVANDEQGHWDWANPPDDGWPGYSGYDGENSVTQREMRSAVVWGNLMAGGAGVELYAGYDMPENDMTLEDFRSRNRMWDYCRYAKYFFNNHIPFSEMVSENGLIGNGANENTKYCFAQRDKVYAIYLFDGGTTTLDLSDATGTFVVKWFDPRDGGSLQDGSVMTVDGGGTVSIGNPPNNGTEDWTVLVCRAGAEFDGENPDVDADSYDPSVIYQDDFEGAAGAFSTSVPEVALSDFSSSGSSLGLDGSGKLEATANNPGATSRFQLAESPLSNLQLRTISWKATVKMPSSAWIALGFAEVDTSYLISAGKNAGPFLRFSPTNLFVSPGDGTAGAVTIGDVHAAGQVVEVEAIFNMLESTMTVFYDGVPVVEDLLIVHTLDGEPSDPVINYFQIQLREQPTVAGGGAYVDDLQIQVETHEPGVAYRDDYEGMTGTAVANSTPEVSLDGFSSSENHMGLDGTGKLEATANHAAATSRFKLATDPLSDLPLETIRWKATVKMPSTAWIALGFAEVGNSYLISAGKNAGPYLRFTPTGLRVSPGDGLTGVVTVEDAHSAGQVIEVEAIYNMQNSTMTVYYDGVLVVEDLHIVHTLDGVVSEPVIGYFQIQLREQPTIAGGGAYVDDVEVSYTEMVPQEILPINFANIFSSGSVLQRDRTVPIWGTATPGDTITVEINGDSKQGVVDGEGNWRIELDPTTAGGPYTLTAVGGVSFAAELTQVYFGDVWLFTGQSNMEHQLSIQVRNFPNHYPLVPNTSDDFDDMRFAIVETVAADTPADDVSMKSPWSRWQSDGLGDLSATGYFFARFLNEQMDANGMADVPLGFISMAKGGTAIEQWISEDELNVALAANPDLDLRDTASNFYNGMVAPIRDYAVKGAIWYQGEGNSQPSQPFIRIEQYPILKEILLDSWREQLSNPNMPFYFVQLAPYREYTPLPEDEFWAWMREIQESCLQFPNTAMVSIIDSGVQGDIHPPFKDRVGERLARIALDQSYGISTVHRGPTLVNISISDSVATLTFDNVASGLETRAVDAQLDADEIAEGFPAVSVSASELAGFYLCGADKRFYPATQATITGNNEVRISNPADVPSPVAVRYAFQDYPRCNLFNSEGLPAEPFRTDDYAFGEAQIDTSGYTFWKYETFTQMQLAEMLADPATDSDNDGLSLFEEYALGGNPTENDAEEVLPLFQAQGDYFYYVHTERDDDSSLSYTVEFREHLDADDWTTTGVEFVESASALKPNYINVTNRVPMDGDSGFVRLKIED